MSFWLQLYLLEVNNSYTSVVHFEGQVVMVSLDLEEFRRSSIPWKAVEFKKKVKRSVPGGLGLRTSLFCSGGHRTETCLCLINAAWSSTVLEAEKEDVVSGVKEITQLFIWHLKAIRAA